MTKVMMKVMNMTMKKMKRRHTTIEADNRRDVVVVLVVKVVTMEERQVMVATQAGVPVLVQALAPQWVWPREYPSR